MAIYRIARRPGGTSYEVSIGQSDGSHRLIVGFRDREQAAAWVADRQLENQTDIEAEPAPNRRRHTKVARAKHRVSRHAASLVG
jgi:hypothetical protein